MEPWEQHHSVIHMPRYVYNVASVLQPGNVGYLITCTFRREKSATKEALNLLRQFTAARRVRENSNNITGCSEESPSEEEHANRKKLKLTIVDASNLEKIDGLPAKGEKADLRKEFCSADEEEPEVSSKETPAKIVNAKESSDKLADEATVGDESTTSDPHDFMLVKLDTMGVIYISATGETSSSVSGIASKIIKEVNAKERAAPQWCHRILPVQGLCSTETKDVHALVSHLVKSYLFCTPHDGTLNYAVAFNKRGRDGGIEDKTFDRKQCINVVTAAIAEVTSDVKVHLTSPQMVVAVELIPVAGTSSSLICAVSVLSGDLFNCKPKLNIKSLVPSKS